MHRLRVLFLLILGVLCQVAAADVIVYKGTFRQYDPEDTLRTTTGRCFVVFQLPANSNESAGQAAFVRYFVGAAGAIKGKKVREVDPAVELRFGGTQRSDGKFLRVYSHCEANVVEPIFGHKSFFFRGLQGAIPLKPGNADTTITAPEAAVLHGNANLTGISIFGGSYVEQTYTLRQDVQRTLQSNAGSLDITATVNNVVAYVATLHYQ